jgi:microcystin-dependent protein
MAFAGPVSGGSATPPPGWLVCDGHAVSRTQYAALFAAIGTSSGDGDGSTTFNLPDYQGYFLRGVDNGVGRDPDSATRTAATTGGNTGDAVGSVEPGAFGSHTHGVNDPGHNHGGSTTGVNNGGGTDAFRDWNQNGCSTKGFNYSYYCQYSNDFNSHTHAIYTGTTGISIQSSGGHETRPSNAYVNYIIKY